MQYDSRLDMT